MLDIAEDTDGSEGRKHRRELIVLFWIFLLAVFVRLYGISHEDSGFDEISTIKHLAEPTLKEFLAKVRISNPPLQPLYPTMEYYWAVWIGSSDSSLRFLSIIPGLLSVLLIYRLGEQIQSKRAGLLAAFLLCVSPTHIYYSLEIRMYAHVLCLLLLSLICTIQIARSGGVVWWILHTAITGLIVWTHVLGVLILPCEAIFLFCFMGGERIRYSIVWCVLQILAVATLIPWFFTIDYDYIEEQYVTYGLPTVFAYGKGVFGDSLQEMFVMWLARQPLDSASALTRVVLRCLNTVTLTAYAASYVILVYRLYRNRNAESAQGPEREYLGKVILVLSVVCVPVGLLFFVSYVWHPSFFPRYVLISLLGL